MVSGRVEIVRPIMAEDLGIVVRSGDPVRLVRGGTPLPYPDEDSVRDVTGEAQLFVPSDALSEMLVPVYTGSVRPAAAGGHRPGGRPSGHARAARPSASSSGWTATRPCTGGSASGTARRRRPLR